MTGIDYCTTADVEIYSGVDFSAGIGPSTAQVATMISNASRLVDTYAGRTLAGIESIVEYQDASRLMEHMVLRSRPVAAVASLEEVKSDGSLVTLVEGRNRTNCDWWLDDAESGIIRFHGQIGITARQYFKVTYTSGYTAPPMEAKMATIMLVVRQAARAAMNDENCSDRIKDLWRPLLATTEAEYREMLDRVKRNSMMAVTVFGNGGV
jgi:hypothetical protein|tara:strand:- start:1014 stop:1640 length:627 start_codon:yes stop_codon:yes gene_type:complete